MRARLPLRAGAVLAAAAVVAAAASAPALAAPPCPGPAAKVKTLLSGQGVLESVIVSPDGKLFFTTGDAVLRLDAPGAQPQVLAMVEAPGGLAFDADGSLIVGSGNTISNGLMGDQTGPASLVRIDPETGSQSVYATGLSMGNGVDRGPDGSFYASNDFGANIDRVRDGQTERGWAQVQSGNGLVVDSSGRFLYVAQTFQPAAIQRVELVDPPRVTEYIRPAPEDISAGLDGMARDAADNLFVAANAAGQVWKVDRGPSICTLLTGLPPFPDGPSAVATGKGDGPFPAENLYVVSFAGDVIEIADVAEATAPPPSRIRLRVSPRRTRVGRSTRFVFRATAVREGRRRAVRRARVRFAGKRVRTGRRGRARVVTTFERPGRYRARVRLRGLRPGRTSVRVRPAS